MPAFDSNLHPSPATAPVVAIRIDPLLVLDLFVIAPMDIDPAERYKLHPDCVKDGVALSVVGKSQRIKALVVESIKPAMKAV